MAVAAVKRKVAVGDAFIGGDYKLRHLARDAFGRGEVDENLHSLSRRLIELRMEHADLDNLIDRAEAAASEPPIDDLALRRLKKRRLALRDAISRLERELEPPEPA
jgi:hypothetical protein